MAIPPTSAPSSWKCRKARRPGNAYAGFSTFREGPAVNANDEAWNRLVGVNGCTANRVQGVHAIVHARNNPGRHRSQSRKRNNSLARESEWPARCMVVPYATHIDSPNRIRRLGRRPPASAGSSGAVQLFRAPRCRAGLEQPSARADAKTDYPLFSWRRRRISGGRSLGCGR